MTSIYARLAGFLLAVALIFGALFGAYHHGQTLANAEWQTKWDARDTADKTAALVNENVERAKEQERQLSINKVVQSGQQLLDAANAAVAASHASDNSLRATADDLAARLAASEASGNSCTAAAGKAAAHAARVLADVLKLADERAGILAADADQARARGLTCEAGYDAVKNSK
ncbi:DUF2514 family protein [Pseudomonas sp. MWU12-2345]|uniref:DUF2514 family protein n=1 Tax=Pseudomonas sp. MWU12-2345 TaxID=2928689 RepID=UPI00200D8C71|nr:DUF2514 family protein [Pseudomonas sp. MWU12-2345]